VRPFQTGVVLFALYGANLSAGGSFDIDIELKPIRQQIPELWTALNQAFEMQRSGWANRIGNPVNPRLGGTRVGPYCLAGRPRGVPGPDSLAICIHTEPRWLDAAGREVDLPEAERVEERFRSVEIRPLAEE